MILFAYTYVAKRQETHTKKNIPEQTTKECVIEKLKITNVFL